MWRQNAASAAPMPSSDTIYKKLAHAAECATCVQCNPTETEASGQQRHGSAACPRKCLELTKTLAPRKGKHDAPAPQRIKEIDVKTTSNNTEDNNPAKANHGSQHEEQRRKMEGRKSNGADARTTKTAKCQERNTRENQPIGGQKTGMRTNRGDCKQIKISCKPTRKIFSERVTVHFKDQKEGRAKSGTAEIRKGR